MVEQNNYPEVLGPDFDPNDCYGADDGLSMPPGGCPAYQGAFYTNEESGNIVCSYCKNILTTELFDNSEVFDDDDDEEPMDEDESFVPKGDQVINQTDADKRRIDRDNACLKLISKILPVDEQLALYLSNNVNRYELVTKLMRYEDTIPDSFPLGKDLAPKVLAVALFLRNQEATKEICKAAGVNINRVKQYILVLKRVFKPYNDPKVEMDFFSLGSRMGLSDFIIKDIIDDYEKLTPPPATMDRHANTVAWLFVIAKRKGVKITQRDSIKLTGSKTNATISAIRKYRAFLDKLKSPTNEVVEHESGQTDVE